MEITEKKKGENAKGKEIKCFEISFGTIHLMFSMFKIVYFNAHIIITFIFGYNKNWEFEINT